MASDAKSLLNQICQRFVQRPISKDDIVYSVAKFAGQPGGGIQFQATVKLSCLQGQEFAGELATDAKTAEKHAAAQANAAIQPLLANLPPPKAGSKRKSSSGADLALMMSSPTGAAGSGGAVPDNTAKCKLNAICGKLAKRVLQKGDTVYETQKTIGGYQSTVRLGCLPGEWANKVWAGEVCNNKQKSEQAAAQQALQAIMNDPEMSELATREHAPKKPKAAAREVPPPVRDRPGLGPPAGKGKKGKSYGGWNGGWKGKGKGSDWYGDDYSWGGDDMWDVFGQMSAMMEQFFGGDDSGYGGYGGYGGYRSKPRDLPRERITKELPVTGEVLEWKGNMGWVKPHADIDHEMAKKHSQRVFVSKKDLQGCTELAQGQQVQFHVYTDSSGIGGEEVTPF